MHSFGPEQVDEVRPKGKELVQSGQNQEAIYGQRTEISNWFRRAMGFSLWVGLRIRFTGPDQRLRTIGFLPLSLMSASRRLHDLLSLMSASRTLHHADFESANLLFTPILRSPVEAGLVEKVDQDLWRSCGARYGARKGLLELAEF
jgi:hypothetical protein